MRPERKECPDCGSPLGKSATKCRCGWKAVFSATALPAPGINCCHAACLEGAICRVWTKTGWANVCKTHFAWTEVAPRLSTSPHVEQLRAQCKRILDRRREGQEPPRSDIDKALQASGDIPGRAPGEDDEEVPQTHDEYALLMAELADRANA